MKLLSFVLYVSCLVMSSFAHQSPEIMTYFPFSLDNNHFDHKLCGIRITQDRRNSYYSSDYSAAIFQQMFQEASSEYDILNNYELYAFSNFWTYARTLPCYEEFILSLQEKITKNKNFRKKTACISGFSYSFSWKTEKSGFHDFVHDEARKICDAQNQKNVAEKKDNLHGNAEILENLLKKYTRRVHNDGENYNSDRLDERIKAINDTRSQQGKCFDYSSYVSYFSMDDCYAQEFNNTYGTQLVFRKIYNKIISGI